MPFERLEFRKVILNDFGHSFGIIINRSQCRSNTGIVLPGTNRPKPEVNYIFTLASLNSGNTKLAYINKYYKAAFDGITPNNLIRKQS